MGGATTEAKVFEAKNVFELEPDQLDFMANIDSLKAECIQNIARKLNRCGKSCKR